MATHSKLAMLGVLLLAVMMLFAACAPAATPAAPPPASTNPPAPTTLPPTEVPTTAPTAAPTELPAATATAAPLMGKPVTLQMASDDKLGKFLADGNGMTLYLFTKDTANTSNCYGKCESAWPPVIPDGAPTLMDGVDAALISTTLRTDGSMQLTYNGWPLYYYFEDTKPGDVIGQAANDVWWVVSGEGNAIKPAAVNLGQDDKLGKFLVDGAGSSLYLYTKDTPGVSNCYGKCEAAWPPLLSVDQPTLGDNIATSLISTTLRKDGSTQLTYNGWPLYYYAKDATPGDVSGQAVGKVWWVVSGEGNPIKPATVALTPTEKLGQILVDADGRTLYMFEKDAKDTSNCYDKCEIAWPPLLTLDTAAAGEGVDAALLGTTQRKDGTLQVTYNGMPLYYYLKDEASGDTAGQGVGSVWYVVTADGKAVK